MKLTLDNIDALTLTELIAHPVDCQCGKAHTIGIKKIVIEQGAIKKTAEVLKELGYKKALLLTDAITWKIAGKDVAAVLDREQFPYQSYSLDGGIIPDEKTVGKILIHTEKDIDVIVSVGTGVLNDLGKFVSFKMGIDNIIIATAPSVDGFASIHAALIIENLKISYSTACPKAIIGDVDVMKEAPMPMIIAGWSDIVGKYSALRDWQISQLVNDEYYCPVIHQMVYKSIRICTEGIEQIKQRQPKAIGDLMESIVLTGVAMGFVGSSRPASGSEHHLSHCWEMMALMAGKKPVPHGTQVGIASVIIAKLHDKLANSTIDFAKAIEEANKFDEADWESGVRKYYGINAPEIVAEIKAEKRYAPDNRVARIRRIEREWAKIQNIAATMPKAEKISEILRNAGAPSSPIEVGISAEAAVDAICVAKEVRPKYTILGLLDDLGLLRQFAGEMRESW